MCKIVWFLSELYVTLHPNINIKIMKQTIFVAMMTATMAVSAMPMMAQKYHVVNVERERITIDSKYAADKDAEAFLAPYKQKVDSTMSPVVGESAKYMAAYGPESELSNLLADIMVWCGTKYNEKPVVGIYNMGGIRAALPKGKITFGDINDIAPFENKICFLTLSGAQLKILFQQMTQRGAGVSHGVVATYDKHMQLQGLKINGVDVDDEAAYRIATIDYLIQGNDGFREFRNGTNLVSPKDKLSNTRFLICDYFREQTKQGRVIDSNIEGRIVVK